jgi:hypothetical protein
MSLFNVFCGESCRQLGRYPCLAFEGAHVAVGDNHNVAALDHHLWMPALLARLLHQCIEVWTEDVFQVGHVRTHPRHCKDDPVATHIFVKHGSGIECFRDIRIGCGCRRCQLLAHDHSFSASVRWCTAKAGKTATGVGEEENGEYLFHGISKGYVGVVEIYNKKANKDSAYIIFMLVNV